VLTVRGVHKTYRRGLLGRDRPAALDGVDFSLEAGERVAVVGASAAGKSTLAKCIAGWEVCDRGEIRLAADARVQLIPQHAGDSLNPRFTAAEIVEEPLRIRGMAALQRREEAIRSMELVQLPRGREKERPDHFSGGERVRLAIARALTVTTDGGKLLLIFDESFSSLDGPLRQQILDLLAGLQARLPLTYLLIVHDLALAERFASRMVTMNAGRIV
jgi:ABC-type dipeptide/oligopeptide/nickel transport system ATPase subunit